MKARGHKKRWHLQAPTNTAKKIKQTEGIISNITTSKMREAVKLVIQSRCTDPLAVWPNPIK